MDFAYSPHRESGGMVHLPSPTHHGYRMEGAHFSSIQQIRRSLSRSPSKPSRFQLRSGKSDSPASPISPLALSRAFSPKPHKPVSPVATYPESPFTTQAAPPTKKKFSLRRTAPFRSSPRNRNPTSKSPRRALGDSTDLGNSSPFVSRPLFGDENTSARKTSAEFMEKLSAESKRFDIDDKPIKFEFARPQQQSANAPGANCFVPAQSSPLKRRDGISSLGSTNIDSPVAKRRSLHGATSGLDFSIFDQTPAPRSSAEEPLRSRDSDFAHPFSSPMPNTQSPVRRTSSLRKSTLSQRVGSSTPRPKASMDGEFVRPGPAASRANKRMSLPSSLSLNSETIETPVRKSTFEPSRPVAHQPFLRGGAGSHQPHPLSNALTASSSSSSMAEDMADDSPTHAPPHAPPTVAPRDHRFSKSLPLGISRPKPEQALEQSEQESFATPFAWKMAKPNPGPFMSTGLLSKKNRNVDEQEGGAIYQQPDTPTKRMSFPPAVVDSPLGKRGSLFGSSTQSRPEFGTPSTPFSVHASKFSTESFGKGVGIFGSFGSTHQRRGSFVSIDGDDTSNSPIGNHMTDSQSSADDMPPTPTKHSDGAGRRSKESSLRRRTFRHRASLGNDTFSAPDTPSIDIPSSSDAQNVTSTGASPHTPSETFAPPDPSRLTISGNRRGSLPFNSSFGSNSFPPATPTTPRDHSNFFADGQAAIPIGLTKNDVDEALTSRFGEVRLLDGGEGEFSKVYRVSRPVGQQSPFSSPPGSQVWVVKKTKRPYIGASDRERKMREVEILYALRGNDHVLAIKGHWEHQGHLYIQTEYCEGGNLRKFLNSAGYSSRLDDFRIWKILLELSLGLKFIHESGFIHLDMKPANILIDFEGVLKVGDFGLGSRWPAPPHIDGEGDRHYLAPEALQGRFDKPADIFALGVMLAEIAGNCIIPEYGEHWQKLRSGEFDKVLPSLTWSADSGTLSRDSNGDPIPEYNNESAASLCMSDAEVDPLSSMRIRAALNIEEELAKAPRFMIDDHNPDAMDQVVKAMMHPDPDQRPTADQVYRCFGCQWVEERRRAGATIYEGNFGPGEDVLSYSQHFAGAADMMDTS